jgi:hypothetical protein
MLSVGYVPDAFGQGILVPIPKGDKKMYNLIEDYRGITISVVISKVFEHVMLIQYQSYFVCSERQFGFKNGVGCCHAIYAL